MTITICTDCHLAHNGYDEHELGHKPDREPLSLIGDPLMLVPDMDYCDDDWDKWADGYFSWHSCHGCGSQLGGTRWEYRILEPANR